MEIKSINEWTLEELKALPSRSYGEDIGYFDSLIIIPTDGIHDSGYRCMDFVAVKDNVPVCLLSGCSDVIHIDGIGGYSIKNGGLIPKMPKAWSIDCLKESGLLQLWVSGYKLTAGLALSDFQIFANKD